MTRLIWLGKLSRRKLTDCRSRLWCGPSSSSSSRCLSHVCRFELVHAVSKDTSLGSIVYASSVPHGCADDRDDSYRVGKPKIPMARVLVVGSGGRESALGTVIVHGMHIYTLHSVEVAEVAASEAHLGCTWKRRNRSARRGCGEYQRCEHRRTSNLH